jgi:hypothetical protein
MQAADRPNFLAALTRTFATYGKPLPDPEVLGVWVTTLDPYPIEGIARALAQHVAECRFAPVPADVTSRLPRQTDDRPDANEAWAISLRSRDERDTVVWTQECAEAFSVCLPVLEGGDEVGARMAFKSAYERIVERERAAGRQAQWMKSLGFDADRRDAVLAEGIRAGRLQLEDVRAVAPQLAAPDSEYDLGQAERNLDRLKQLTSTIPSARERMARLRAAEESQQRKLLDTIKADTQRRVDEYRGDQ